MKIKKNDDEGGGSSESTETLTNIEMLPDCRIMYPELMKVTDNSFLTALSLPKYVASSSS